MRDVGMQSVFYHNINKYLTIFAYICINYLHKFRINK